VRQSGARLALRRLALRNPNIFPTLL